MEAPKCTWTGEWIKMWCIYNQCICSHKKEWNHAICSNMDGPKDYGIKWSKSKRKRQIPHDIACLWNLINHGTSGLIYKTEADS